MKTTHWFLVGFTLLIATGCGKSSDALSDQEVDSQASLDAVSDSDVTKMHLAVAVEGDGTAEVTPIDTSSGPNVKHKRRILKVKRFLRQNRATVKELHAFVKANAPELLTGKAKSRKDRIAKLRAIVDFLESRKSELSPEGQALLDRLLELERKFDQPEPETEPTQEDLV